MSIGLLMISRYAVSDTVHYVKLAEESGYDTGWLADERFYREVYSCLTYLSTQTSRLKLGPCVTDPYARHPALTASAIATLDEISGGRAMLAIGAGISGFAELGVDRKKPARAIREAIEIIRPLLRGEEVDYHGEVVSFNKGRLSFKPRRAEIPIYVASNGPLGQRSAGMVADGALMEGCASVAEAKAFRAQVERGAREAGREPGSVKIIARLNTYISDDGAAARDALRPAVARYLGARRLKMATLEEQGLALPETALESVAGAHYASGYTPYLPLLPLITDRHVDALTLAGTVEEVTEHVIELRKAGVDSFIIMPFAAEGDSLDKTIRRFGTEVWPAAERAMKA
jgi:5,10-methylenetetrahydromethanopterin reductase